MVYEVGRITNMLRGLSPRAVLLSGFTVFLVYAYPGYMSNDSVVQLIEARTGKFSDGNPPLMAAEWWVLDRIVAGPILMLLLQGTLFLGGLYVIFKRFLTPRHAAWAAVGVLLFPPVLTPMAVIWKDSQMAAYLAVGVAALLQPRLRTRLLGLVALVAACALRWNALAAVVPIVAFLFEWRPGQVLWKRLAILAAAGVVTLALAFGITRALASTHVRLTPAFSDIVAVIACTDDRSDAELRETLRGTSLVVQHGIQVDARLLHALHNSWRIAGGDERLFDQPSNDAQWAALYRAWRELVFGDPAAYLRCKWEDFARILGMTDEPLRAPVWNLFLEDQVQIDWVDHDGSASRIQEWLGRVLYWLADDTPLFRPVVYAVVALLLLVLCCRDRLTLSLLTSGLLYEFSFFPVGAEPDVRYSHWMITCVALSSVILFITRRRKP
jgi:hypothetical protein